MKIDKTENQPTVKSEFLNMTKVELHGAYQKDYYELFLEMIASNCLPFNLARGSISRQMIKYAKEVLEDIQKLVKELCDALGDI